MDKKEQASINETHGIEPVHDVEERKMKIPGLAEASKMFDEAVRLSPGSWTKHSLAAAENARIIAGATDFLDPEASYILALLHDIGKREGNKQFMHVIDGYEYLAENNYTDAARICVTHSFPVKKIDSYSGEFDCTLQQKQFVEEYLSSIDYNEYDKLIQLCDALSTPSGACLIEKRLVDVALRHGFQDCTLDKWRAYLDIKEYFDEICQCNIYFLFSNIEDNTFEK